MRVPHASGLLIFVIAIPIRSHLRQKPAKGWGEPRARELKLNVLEVNER